MKKIHITLLAIVACLFASSSYAAFPFLANSDGKSITNNLPTILQAAMPAVVNVSAQGEIPAIDSPFVDPRELEKSGRNRPRQFESLGSGVIVDANNGYIVTNAHVLKDTKTATVTLKDGRVFKAKLLGMDPGSDIALLQIKADKLTALPMGDSDNLKVGDFVAAIGTPFGLNQTVTSGIVSGLQRSDLGIEGYESFIQTDASINPGNSGGALINIQGQLIGINTAILAPGGGNIGIGFAVPVNMVRGVMGQIVKYGTFQRGLMGVIVQDLTPALAGGFHLPANAVGALVAKVTPNSPAAAAGFQTGDIIQELNGKSIQTAPQLRNGIGMLRVGSRIDLKVLRNGKTVTVSLNTIDPKQYTQVTEQKNPFLAGTTLQNFDQETAALGHVTGVQVLSITENSMAWAAGIRPGDVITSANQTPVATAEQLQKIARDSKDQLLLSLVKRNGGAAFVVVK